MSSELTPEKDKTLRRIFERDRFAYMLGIGITDIKRGCATADMTVREEMLNGADVVNGGVLCTLADFALAVAANSMSENISLTLSLNVQFVKSARCGQLLTATARSVAEGKRIGHFETVIVNEKDETVFIAHGMSYERQNAE